MIALTLGDLGMMAESI